MKSKHGHATKDNISPEYRTWVAMRARCNNPNDQKYAAYGERGIKVCARWNDFGKFMADMGARGKSKRLGRFNINKGYTPANCGWVTLSESMNNRTDSRLLRYQGKKQTIAEWSRETGINKSTIWSRLKRGWTVGDALTY